VCLPSGPSCRTWGGRSVGTVAGWANMWGNFGASAAAKLLPWVLTTLDTNNDWQEVFVVCAEAYAVAFVAVLGMDPRDVVEREQPAFEGTANASR
jgi:nitrate/nitrite transporter NarK